MQFPFNGKLGATAPSPLTTRPGHTSRACPALPIPAFLISTFARFRVSSSVTRLPCVALAKQGHISGSASRDRVVGPCLRLRPCRRCRRFPALGPPAVSYVEPSKIICRSILSRAMGWTLRATPRLATRRGEMAIQRRTATIGFKMKPVGVSSKATRKPPLIPYSRRNAAGMVTRPRVENRTV